MAQQIYNIASFPTGYYMSWFVTTQAAFSIQAILADSATTYFNATKQSMDIDPPLAQGAATIQGNRVQLTINIPQSQKIDGSINTYNITTNDGSIVGFGYNICIEDSTDKDYNDVCISLVAWKSKG